MSRKIEQQRNRPSKFGERVLRALEVEEGTRCQDGRKFRIGRVLAPKSVIEELSRNDLVRIGADGKVSLTATGQKLTLRRAAEAARLRGRRQGIRGPDPFAQQHMELREVDLMAGPRRTKVLKNMAEGPLGWLHSRKDKSGCPLISLDQMEAGDQMRRDFEMASLRPKVTASYDGVPRDRRGKSWYRGACPTDVAIQSRKRLDDALKAVGSGLSDVLYRLCCHLEGLEEIERRMGWPQRSGKVVLRLALDRLVDHYQNKKKWASEDAQSAWGCRSRGEEQTGATISDAR